MVSATPRPLYPRGKRAGTHCRGGWVGLSEKVRKISPPPGFDPRTVQSVASRYTDYIIPAPQKNSINLVIRNFSLPDTRLRGHGWRITSSAGGPVRFRVVKVRHYQIGRRPNDGIQMRVYIRQSLCRILDLMGTVSRIAKEGQSSDGDLNERQNGTSTCMTVNIP
jgi:hypothetical protein